MGSVMMGLALTLLGSSRPAIFILIVFFALGAFLLSKVDVERGRRQALAAEAELHAAGAGSTA